MVLRESKIVRGQGFEVVAEDIGEGRGSNRLAGLNKERVSREAIDFLVKLVIGEAELSEVVFTSGAYTETREASSGYMSFCRSVAWK